MNAEILCVGTELLLGDVVNTNAAYIAQQLAGLGINVYHHTVVGDNPARLKKALNIALDRSDIVFMTGGLGPTYDDLTKETVAEYFDREMYMDEDCLVTLKANFARFNRPMTDNNLKQAMMPKGAIVLPNPYGTAPGCIVEGEGKAAVLMPGPPREMKPMFDGPVYAYLTKASDSILVSRNINIFGVGESTVEDRLKDLMLNSTNPTVAPYAKPSELALRVTARAKDKEEGYRLIDPVVQQIMEVYPDNIYGLDLTSLQQGAVKFLSDKGLKVATAESCTGGLVSSRLTEISGSSKVFDCGIVAYANAIKEQVLGVNPATIEKYGAVSAECAVEMAQGVRKLSGADIGVSITGIAGPDGGSEEKPVGLVYVCVSSKLGSEVRELKLARGRVDDRENIRYSSSSNALDLLIKTAKKL